MWIIGCALEITGSCSMLRARGLSCIRVLHRRDLMTKAALKNFTTELARKRRQVSRLQEDLRDMLDHLAIIEARAKSTGTKRYSTDEAKKALGL
jgi:hypothetical protein